MFLLRVRHQIVQGCQKGRTAGAVDHGMVHFGVDSETAFGKIGDVVQPFDNIGFPQWPGHIQRTRVEAGGLNA